MGNICCGARDEHQKSPLVEGLGEALTDPASDGSRGFSEIASQATTKAIDASHASQTKLESGIDQAFKQEHLQKKLEAQRLEQVKLDMIVQAAGRRMVAVRSTRGTTAYYDQGFAAALSQHLEQTTKFNEQMEYPLPAPHSSPVRERLSQPVRGITLGKEEETSKLAGGRLHEIFDAVVAKPLLEELVPNKGQLFAGVEPMVESLL